MGTMHEENERGVPEGLRQIAHRIEDDDDAEGETDGKAREEERKKRLQKEFRSEAKKKMMRVSKQATTMITAACEEMGKRHLSDRLPSAFTPRESSLTQENRSENGGRIWPNTLVRLARPGVARLVGDVDYDGGAALNLRKGSDTRGYRGQDGHRAESVRRGDFGDVSGGESGYYGSDEVADYFVNTWRRTML